MSTSEEPLVQDDKQFDAAEVLSCLDNNWQLFETLTTIWEEDWPKLINEIRVHNQRGDYQAVRSASHRLKGLVSNFRLAPLVAALDSLERKAAAADLANSEAMINVISDECNSLTLQLKKTLRQNEEQ